MKIIRITTQVLVFCILLLSFDSIATAQSVAPKFKVIAFHSAESEQALNHMKYGIVDIIPWYGPIGTTGCCISIWDIMILITIMEPIKNCPLPLTMKFRRIEKKDNPEIADLIRIVFREFKIDRPGTVYTDPATDDLYNLFNNPGSEYWIAEEAGTIIGGCGIYPTTGLPQGCAELVKFYVASSSRGLGIGKQLMEKCFKSAKRLRYRQLYLETLPELDKAVGMYEKAGFHHLPERLGNSGHYSCNIWMLKEL